MNNSNIIEPFNQPHNLNIYIAYIKMQNQQHRQDNEEGSIFLKVNRFQVEENAVFIDYNQHQILSNIENYKTLSFYHRVSLSKNIAAVKEVCNGHTLFHHFLLQLAADGQQIKQELVEYLRTNLPKANALTDFQHLFIEPLIRLINSPHLQIREESCVLLTQITHKLTGKERKEVLRLALQLQKSQDEESKIISIHLIAKMTPDMPPEQAEAFFKTDYLEMYKHSSVRIKRQIIHNAHTIARNVRKEFLNKQIIEVFFVEKCKEPIWGIRKTCIEIIPQLVVLTDTKKELLANILIALTKDSNKMVKIAAYKAIPQFLANYNSHTVPDKLVNMYIHLMDSEVNELLNRDGEIAVKVAYYFPGVMLTLGQGKWEIMKKLFNRLLLHKSNEVKMPIASSLHEISRIIGPQLSKEYMFRALDIIIKDHTDAIKLAAISHISEFVQLFQQTTRQNLIDVFLQLQKDPKKWRVRYEIANQLNILSKIYETQTVFKYIFPISLKLCNDNVYQVRFQAARKMYHVIDNMKELPHYQQMALQSLKGYALSQKYVQRETFAWMIKNLYKIKQFKQILLDLIIQIAKDKIPVVRIALAISLSEIQRIDPQNVQMFRPTIQILKKDEQDVNEYLL